MKYVNIKIQGYNLRLQFHYKLILSNHTDASWDLNNTFKDFEYIVIIVDIEI